MIRRFELIRCEDESGVSGTGKVAEGVQFSSGKSVINWLSKIPSLEVYDHIDEVLEIHGHGDKSRLRWLDTPPD